MRWIKRHKFWIAALLVILLCGFADYIFDTRLNRVVGQIIGIILVFKLVFWIFKNKKKEDKNVK